MINPLTTYLLAIQELAEATNSLNQAREIISAAQEEMLKIQEWELPEEL